MSNQDGIYFDADEAQFHCDFAESLTLTKSTMSGRPEPLVLLEPHRKLIANVHGWRRADGSRLYRRVYYSTARKNSKTTISAVMGLDMLIADNESSPEIYIAGKTREQASYCFSAVVSFIRASEELSDMLRIVPSAKEVHNSYNNGILKALSSESKSKFGSNPSCTIIDEYFVWGPSEKPLYEALTTGSLARRQPLTIILTTAGDDEYSLCGREYQYAKDILAGHKTDPTYLPLIWELDKDDDWTDESLWHKANPTLGKIVRLESLRDECEKAKQQPSEQTTFRKFYMNQWLSSTTIWIPKEKWDPCKWRGIDER